MSLVAGKCIEEVIASGSETLKSVAPLAPNAYYDLHVTPLVEIFAISVHCDDENIITNEGKIYGKISVTLEDDEEFAIFDQNVDNPMSIALDHSLLLTSNVDDTAVVPSKYVSLKVKLYDKARCDTVVADGDIALTKTTQSEDWLEDYQDKTVSGSNGIVYAKVHYAIFPYAVSAAVKIIYFDKADDFDPIECEEDCYTYDEDDDYRMESSDVRDMKTYQVNDEYPAANLYGTVSASTGVTGNSDITSSLLFSKAKNDSVRVKSRGFIELSRPMVVVPPYSSLAIKADFYDADTESLISSGIVEFKPSDEDKYKKDIVGANGCRIRVQVTWSNARELFFYVSGLPSTSDINEIQSDDSEEEQELSSEHHSSADDDSDVDLISEDDSSADDNWNCVLPNLDNDRLPLMELFSVVVCSKDGKPFKFYGEVFINDGPRNCVFKKDKSCPQDCPNSGMLAILEGPSRSVSTIDDLSISVDLKDVAGGIISSGDVTFRNIDDYKVANERMCSVIRGERGFAAVHYSIFLDGVSAHINVKLHSKHLPCGVKGKIYARYVNDDVPKLSYQENLYKSIVFYNVDGGVALDTSGSTLPLAKPVISVPRHSYLIIEAELSIGGESLTGNSSRIVCNDDDPVRIGDGDLFLEVFVKFITAWVRCEDTCCKTRKTVLQ